MCLLVFVCVCACVCEFDVGSGEVCYASEGVGASIDLGMRVACACTNMVCRGGLGWEERFFGVKGFRHSATMSVQIVRGTQDLVRNNALCLLL